MTTTLKLGDRVYELRWTERASARLSSLDRPPTFADLRRPRKNCYATCAIIWASITERGHRFVEPEDLAEYIKTEEEIVLASNAIGAMLAEAFPPDPDEKKTGANVRSPTMPASGDGPPPSSTSV